MEASPARWLFAGSVEERVRIVSRHWEKGLASITTESKCRSFTSSAIRSNKDDEENQQNQQEEVVEAEPYKPMRAERPWRNRRNFVRNPDPALIALAREKTREFWLKRLRRNTKEQRRSEDPEAGRDIFVVPPVLLDLDAEGSRYVRSYNAKVDGREQKVLWAQNPELAALEGRMNRFRDELHEAKDRWVEQPAHLDRRRITERDILSVAFLGVSGVNRNPQTAVQEESEPLSSDEAQDEQTSQPEPASSVHEQLLGPVDEKLLWSIGIPARIAADTKQAVRVLVQRLREQPPQELNVESVEELKHTLADTDFQQVQRIIAPLLQTKEGCVVVSRCAHEIIDACTRERHLFDEDYVSRVFIFLKTVSSSLATLELEFDLSSHPSSAWLEGLFLDPIPLD
ncbi:hypothetical protein B0T17DRAFT_507213 [Bombardia bombarda]|uniref:Uncharacterized protein n=1 Tax=Bombardia bombarda TaxID=252184 RepID=A0AA40CB00_9PEZI|nr:hypothetical protein B0T17DRAFT_507213 [Bombardia bombarda]